MADIKRSSPLKVHGARSSDPYTNLTPKQLELIGAIAMIYNESEGLIESICAMGLRPPIDPHEVLSRINGMDGIKAIAKMVAAHWGFTEEEMKGLCDTLGKAGFELLKGWRDGIIHARVFDVKTSIGKQKARQGRIFDVLLTEDALQGVYNRLNHLSRELRQLELIMARRYGIKAATSDRERELHEAKIPIEWTRYLSHRSQRLGLPPLPEFPADIPDFEPLRIALATQSRAAE